MPERRTKHADDVDAWLALTGQAFTDAGFTEVTVGRGRAESRRSVFFVATR